MKFLVENAALVMGLLSFVGGVAAWYRGAVQENYAAERDFGHLKNNYASLSSNVAAMDKMLDAKLDQMQLQQVETKALLQAVLSRLGGDSSQLFNKK